MAETKAAHTPGEWIIDNAACEGAVYCSDATGSIVARTTGDGFEFARRSPEEWQANARLIAAAPELLDALKACRDLVGMLVMVATDGSMPSVAAIVTAADTAIAKAEGR